VGFVAGNSNKSQKLGLEWAFNVFTLLNQKNFNSENAKNKECIDTWANGTGYTSMSNDVECFVICGPSKFYFCVFVAIYQ
jgi:hypothetical protein